jgi:hypothetical protein
MSQAAWRIENGAEARSPSARSRPKRLKARATIYLDSCRHAHHQAHALRRLINVDVHRHALREAHPGEDRIDWGEPRLIWLRIRDVDAACDAADVSSDDMVVPVSLMVAGSPSWIPSRFVSSK